MRFAIFNAGSRIVDRSCDNVIVQGTWLTVVATYRASTKEYWLTVNNVSACAGTASDAVTDRTVSGTYMGKSWFGYRCVTSTQGGAVPGTPCYFPFEYKGQMFSECSTQDYSNAWCSTTPVYSGKWGECLCQTDQSYFNGDIAGVFVVDEYLSTDATSAIGDAMARA
jgi:hypothetical protein